MASDASWIVHPNLSRYSLAADVVVGSAHTLDIASGITISTTNSLVEMFIDGTVNATGASFTGAQTEVYVRDGGTLNLDGATVAGQFISYEAGSQGSISGSSFSTARLGVYSAGVQDIAGNNFQSSTPVETLPSSVPLFYGTNTYAVSSTIDVVGTSSGDATWQEHPNLRRYNIAGDVVIPSSYELIVQPNLIITRGTG